MSEIKPVAWRQKRENVGHSSPLARGTREGTYTEPLYDQQAIDTLRGSLEFYRRRSEALQAIQHHMRDPERKAVCDILANGQTYVYADTAK